jgi:hypothetical protein
VRGVAVLLLLVGMLVAACGGDERRPSGSSAVVEDPGAVHVHGLGVNPKDGALFIATHTGLFRAPAGATKAKRVGDRYQDTMGFAVVGPDRFLGSGHPDGREELPPFLGLIASDDAGKTWEPVSLRGKVDFHVLEAAGQTIYGFGSEWETREPVLLTSSNGGRTWDERTPPEPLLDLVIDPADTQLLIATGERGLYRSTDGGRRWRPLARETGLLAWPRHDRLFRVDLEGKVRISADAGQSWQDAGSVGGQPAAFDLGAPGELLAALHDGTIKQSRNDGRSWTIRSVSN